MEDLVKDAAGAVQAAHDDRNLFLCTASHGSQALERQGTVGKPSFVIRLCSLLGHSLSTYDDRKKNVRIVHLIVCCFILTVECPDQDESGLIKRLEQER